MPIIQLMNVFGFSQIYGCQKTDYVYPKSGLKIQWLFNTQLIIQFTDMWTGTESITSECN